MSGLSKFLIITGVLLIVIGLVWPWLQKVGLGQLPGDVVIKRKNMTFYFPIVTCIIISVIVSLFLWLFRR